MSQKKLHINDVLWLEVKRSPTEQTTNTVEEISQAICEKPIGNAWVRDGVECSVLFENESGWRKGKVRIVLEFVPDDEPESEPEVQQATSQPLLPSSSSVEAEIATIRKKII